MKRILSAVLAAVFLCSVMTVFTSCHGSRLAADFTMPQGFDTSKNYEITFWAKNDTNKTQVKINGTALADWIL